MTSRKFTLSAVERLAKGEEREITSDLAAQEHAENEEFLDAIRGLLRLSPEDLRSRADHEKELEPRPFPRAERSRADAERCRRELEAHMASWSLPRDRAWTLLNFLGLLLVLAGLGAVFFFSKGGGALALLGALILAAARIRRSLRCHALREAEEARARWDIETRIERDSEEAGARHEEAEKARTSALQALLAGDPAASRKSFQAAQDRIALPLPACARLKTLTSSAGQIHVQLYPLESIPVQRSTLLKTGRLSYRNRSQKDVREDDARAMASLMLLYAALSFDSLPAATLLNISAFRRAVDPATGHDADLCMASLIFDRAGFTKLKLDRLDPIAALRSFPCRFSCSAAFLLKPVEPFSPEEVLGEEDLESSGAGSKKRTVGLSASAPAEEKKSASPRATAFEIAQQVLVLTMACARADGSLDAAESEAIGKLMEEHFPLIDELGGPAADSKRLALRRAALAAESIRIEEPAKALRSLLSPRER